MQKTEHHCVMTDALNLSGAGAVLVECSCAGGRTERPARNSAQQRILVAGPARNKFNHIYIFDQPGRP
jgi:hypothetical protein